MTTYQKLTMCFIAIALTGCGTTNIQDKHNEMMNTYKGKNYYATASPITFSHDKQMSYRWACFKGAKEPSYWNEAKPTNHFNAYGGRSYQEVEEYALNNCENKTGRSCVILLLNGYDRCAATFDAAYEKALAKVDERKNLLAKQKSDEEIRKTEAMKNSCIAFGFVPNTPQMSTCVMELFKTSAQVEAIRQAADSQVQATNAIAEETTRLLQFQQGMELLRQSNQLINPTQQQNRLTTNCRYNTVMKTIACN